MIDIIVPCWTKKIPNDLYKCIESIIKNTKDFNLIIVGSEDTQPKNINKGIARAMTEFFCIVDWDIVVQEGWLDKLVQALKDNEKLGIVTPSIKGEQAKHFRQPDYSSDEVVEKNTVIGACMVCRNIGLNWDENFKSGYWADTDFARQYKDKGYWLGVHGGVEIDHAIKTTLGEKEYVDRMMSDGEMVYYVKYGDLNV